MGHTLKRFQQRLAAALWPRRLSTWLAAVLAGIFLAHGSPAMASTPERYSHSVWTTRDGLPGPVRAMAQTIDGWLWLGTSDGLYRFDGLRFHPMATANGGQLLSTRISALTAEPNGDLYIGYEDFGLSVLYTDGRLEHLAPAGKNSPVTRTHVTLRDIDGTLWAGTSSGLMRLKDGRWTRIGAAQGYGEGPTFALIHDANRHLWAANATQLFRYERALRRFVAVDLPAPFPAPYVRSYHNLVLSPDGRLWDIYGARFTLVATPQSGATRPANANARMRSWEGLFDREGQVWGLRCASGICVAPAARSVGATRIDMDLITGETVHRTGQRASLLPDLMLEDREGNIWTASNNSLERFRKNAAAPVDLPPTNGTYHVAPDADGSVWIVTPANKVAWRYDPASRRLTEVPGVYRGAHRSADGSVVLLTQDGIRRRRAGVEDLIALPTLPPGAWVRTDGERIWLGGASTPVQTWDGREWRSLTNPRPEEFTFSAAGRHGQMWRGLVDGRLLLFEGGKITREIGQAALGGIGTATCLSAVAELVVCGESGVSAWDGRRFRRLQAARPELLRKVSGVLVTDDGTRWLNGSAGLLRVEAADWRRSLDTGAQLRATVLDALDGLPGPAAAAPSLTMVGNRLWVATNGGVVELDPAAQLRNPVAPRVALLGLSADGTAYPLAAPRIHAGVTRLRFDFTAPSLRKPERVRFSYRLDGVDDAWQTGAERSATYTGLAPGAYVFRVRAMNEDGVWSEAERTLAFDVAPTMVQTVHFRIACGLAVLLLLWLAYRLRLRFLTRSLNRRHQVQLEERTRIARELHDSLLQNFQGAVLEMRAALGGLGADSPLHERLQAGVRNANAAIAEGREKVEDLRDAGAGQPGLLDCLRQVSEGEARPGQHVTLRVEGAARPLQPVVEQELCAIGREALRNALRHAGAQRHDVLVEYGARSLVLIVSDDGIGVDAEAWNKPGHWGLRGIEERARLIHAEAGLLRAPGGGTVWRIEIKAELAYAGDGRRWWRPS